MKYCFAGLHIRGYQRSYIELGGDNAAVFSAVGNTLANIGSWLAPIVGAAVFRRTASWQVVYGSCIAVYWAAAGFWLAFIAVEQPHVQSGCSGSGAAKKTS
jgi:hypothetical protein